MEWSHGVNLVRHTSVYQEAGLPFLTLPVLSFLQLGFDVVEAQHGKEVGLSCFLLPCGRLLVHAAGRGVGHDSFCWSAGTGLPFSPTF